MPFESEAQRRFMYSQHPKLAKEFEAATPKGADLPERKKMAQGGEIEGDKVEMPKKEMIKEHEEIVKNLQPAAHEMEKQKAELQDLRGYAHGGISDEEKRAAIYKAMGMEKYAGGGFIPQPPTGPQLNMPNQNDPGFWDAIKGALSKISAPVTRPLGVPLADIASKTAEAAAPVIADMAGPATSALNQVTGLNLPVPPPAPKAPEGDPMPLSAQTPPPQPPSVAPVKPEMTKTPPVTPKQAPASTIDQNVSKLTEGYEAEDRQALADRLNAGQTDIGSIIAQAVAGLGDAIAAKGGHNQDALKDIFGLQKQQRDEALANFDKARQARLEKLDLQTKALDNAIKQAAMQRAGRVDENLNKMVGAPAGTKVDDLPLYSQALSAKAAAAEKDTELRMRAMKQAADDIDNAAKGASMWSFKPSAAQRQAQGAKLADQYFHRAKGNVLFQSSDGQNLWIKPSDVSKAQQIDPKGKVVQ